MSLNQIKFIYLFIFLSFFPILGESINEYLVKGEQFYQEKDYKEALNNYKSALKINKNSTRAHLGFAKTSLALNSLTDAKNSFEAILNLEPKNKEAIAGLCEVLSRQGKHKEALEMIEEALKDEPYNAILLLQRPRILLRMGNKETALKRLEDVRKKIDQSYEYSVLLVQAYIANQKFREALEIVNQLLVKNPENPESFLEKAKLNYELASREKDQQKILEYMQEARELLLTSINLSPNYESGKRLLIKNSLWLDNKEEALRFCNELLEQDPNDPQTLYYRAYLNAKLDEIEKASKDFGKLIKLRETENLARYAAEEFAINKLEEKHPLRVNLGRFQLDQYEKTKDEFLYTNANFHILRAAQLIPENRKLKAHLSEHYYRLGDRKKLIQLLIQMREDDPDDIRIHNRLENVLKTLRNSLAYREGYLQKDASIEEGIRTENEIYVFDLQPSGFFPDYPDISHILTSVLKYALSFHPKVKLVNPEEEKKIREIFKNQVGLTNYTESIYYRPELLAKLFEIRKRDNSIRFVVYGNIDYEINNLSISLQIYDKNLGKIIKNTRVSAFGRDRLTDLAVRLAEEIIKILPIEGKVIKVKKESIIANIGFRDGLKKTDLLSVEWEDKSFEGKISELDEFFCEIVFEKENWKSQIGTEYSVRRKPSKEKK